MKTILPLIIVLLLAATANAQAPAGSTYEIPHEAYGTAPTLEDAALAAFADITANINEIQESLPEDHFIVGWSLAGPGTSGQYWIIIDGRLVPSNYWVRYPVLYEVWVLE